MKTVTTNNVCKSMTKCGVATVGTYVPRMSDPRMPDWRAT
jgi:hypothetical protein